MQARAIPYVDAYADFMHHADPASLYRKDDTHWSTEGCHQWLAGLNRHLVEISER